MSDFPGFGDDFFDLLENYQGARVPGEFARYRQGGSNPEWARPGSSKYVPINGFIQVGSRKWTGAAATSGSLSYNFPIPFNDEPLLLFTVVKTTPLGVQVVCQPWSDGPGVDLLWWSAANVTEIWFHWLAYGPGDIR